MIFYLEKTTIMKKYSTLLFGLLLFFNLFSCKSLKEANVPSNNKPLKFAVISDIHNDIMHDGEKRLKDFLAAAYKNKVDFIIQLGDFCQAKNENQSFLQLWKDCPIPKYSALGNHDMDNCTKEQYVNFIGIKERYYSFDCGDFHCIVLDPNNLYKEGKYIPYNKGNYYIDMKMREYIDTEQIEWLKADLKATDKRCMVFSHQSLENTVPNGELVRSIFESENKRVGYTKVIVAFSGHNHTNYERVINEIAYIQINSASNQWVDQPYKCVERFDEETNKEHPALKYVVPYEKAIYAIVALKNNTLKIKGKTSRFIPPTPKDLNIPKDYFPFPLVPWIKDYSFKF